MRQLLNKANTKLTVGWAAAMLSGMSLLTTLLSLFRERLLNANPIFGAGTLDLDAYRVAFKFPDFVFIMLVSGALSVTFIPVLNERLGKGNRKSAWDMSASLLNLLAVTLFFTSLLIIIFAGPIVRSLLAPGMAPAGQDLAIVMMRIIAFNPFLFAISSVLTSMQQAIGRFFFFAFAPAMYNLAIIFGIVFLAPHFGIIGVAYGVLIGSFAQLAIAAIGMVGIGFEYHNKINWRNQGFRRVLQLLPWRSFDQGIEYFNSLVEINLASRLRQGMINAWEVAYTLHWVPVNIIGVAISTAAFPQLTERINQGRTDLFKKEFSAVLRILIWLAFPVVIVAYFGRGYIVRLLVANGNPVIADLLGLLVLSIFSRAIFHLVARSFYAQQDTKTPFIISMGSFLLNIVLAIYLVMPWGANMGIYGLALAQSIMSVVEVMVMFRVLSHRLEGLLQPDFYQGLLRMLLAAIMTSFTMYWLILILPLRITDVGFFSLVPKFSVAVALTLIVYVLFSYMLKLREAVPVVNKVLAIVFKPVKIQ